MEKRAGGLQCSWEISAGLLRRDVIQTQPAKKPLTLRTVADEQRSPVHACSGVSPAGFNWSYLPQKQAKHCTRRGFSPRQPHRPVWHAERTHEPARGPEQLPRGGWRRERAGQPEAVRFKTRRPADGGKLCSGRRRRSTTAP